MIHNGDDILVVKLARILQSYNRIKAIVPEKTLVELKMIKELSLDSETLSSLDEEEYLGMEDKTKEFKTSFVFPPDKSQHMSANLLRCLIDRLFSCDLLSDFVTLRQQRQ